MPPKTKKKTSIPVTSVRHKDKRANIPTKELSKFLVEDEAKPKTVQFPGLLYARDPSLDPQLVWKEKDEQDRQPLEVPSVPIYIQEKVHPQVLIENLRETAKAGEVEPEFQLFKDFNGIKFEQLIEFYQHKDGVNWANRLILGDSLLVMTSLAEKEGLKGKVQTLFLDPPYGIRFGSNWQVSTRKREVKDGSAEDVTRQPEQVRAFRDTWRLGIHSYLSYLRDRLVVARELLTESGNIFVQIGDENVHLVRSLLDEVFGSENFISNIVFRKTGGAPSDYLANVADHILWFAKTRKSLKFRSIYSERVNKDGIPDSYPQLEYQDGKVGRLTDDMKMAGDLPAGVRPFQSVSLESAGLRSGDLGESFSWQGVGYHPRDGAHWKTGHAGLRKLGALNRLLISGNSLRYKMYLDDFPVMPITNVWGDTMGASDLVYVVQTNTKVVERCILMTTDPCDLVLDPTCGSGTTAYVAEQWGRRWITVDTSRVAVALARTRLMGAKFPYYLLADSPEGVMKESEIAGQLPTQAKTESDIRRGFVYKRVPHVTLKSITNNPDIKEGMSRAEIDKAVDRHADTEILYDQPYDDGKRIRVTGPFTVESLSPHRVLSTDDDRPASEADAKKEATAGQFETMIMDNLRKAGVQNTRRAERLQFDRLDVYSGTWLHGSGEYTENGKTKRVAISLGPEHGTVSPEQVKEASKDALKGAGFDLLIVCGFAFDAHANETAKEFTPYVPKRGVVAESRRAYGKLPVLLARMNPDLAMGDELLKKTGAGNLFMVFGEPDIDIKKNKDGKFVATVKGVDVYDPTTGQIRNSSTDDIACWFIDTNYNEESFFVRHAYFTGADEPYEKLKRALRADIDESAWSTLYSTTSRPFDPPTTGKIAIKVINHYGDEVLKVYDVK